MFSSSPKDVRVMFPPEAQGLARGFRQPPWTSEMTLYDYLPLAQAAVERPWRERKHLVATLAARHSVLEYDAQDFTLLHLFMKVPPLIYFHALFFVLVFCCVVLVLFFVFCILYCFFSLFLSSIFLFLCHAMI